MLRIIKLMIQKLKRLVQIQKTRYAKKGRINCIIAASLLLGIMWASVQIGKVYWPKQVENKSQFVFIWSYGLHFFFMVLSYLLYAPGYFGWSAYYDQFLINKKSSRPWERKNWKDQLTRVVKQLVFNQLIIFPIALYIPMIRGTKLRFHDFPEFSQVFLQIIFIIYYIEDFFTFWGHKLFHLPYFYKLHKVHHEIDAPYTWTNQYFHPADWLIANLLPSGIAFMVLGGQVHCFTYFFWIGFKMLTTSEGHSGYELPWSPMRIAPFISGPSYHDHHHSHNIGNFAGSCYLWDLVLDSNTHYIDSFLKN